MSVAKVVEITSMSPEGFDDAVRKGIERTAKTVKRIEGAWIKEQKVVMNDGKIRGFAVSMKLTFVVDD